LFSVYASTIKLFIVDEILPCTLTNDARNLHEIIILFPVLIFWFSFVLGILIFPHFDAMKMGGKA
jgi:hypothetical protein